ncbi:sensor histidine kinase [Zoogloeaceae bacterium G21618-S1]|nr:sensor histidine kinase [Zoogloeaceae bacterium G21618-S1]
MPSLRRRLLRALLLPGVITLMGGVLAHRTAIDVIGAAYDVSLLNLADGVAERIRAGESRLRMDIADGGVALLRSDTVDTVFYRVRDDDGNLVAGDGDLPPPDAISVDAPPDYYDTVYHGKDIRGVRLHRRVDGHGFYVTVAETLGKRQAALERLLLGFVAAIAGLVVAVVAIVRIAIPSGLSPLAKLSTRLAARDGEDLSLIDPDSVPLELRTLVEALNTVLGRMASAQAQQRSFLQNAAHQLRTPLANLQMQVELLGSSPAPDQLERVTRATIRVTRLANQLLALARAEAGEHLMIDATPVDLALLIDDMLDDWVIQADRRRIDLGVHRQSACVTGDGTLLRELLANLMDNALKYAPTGGRVSLHCTAHAGEVQMTVEDDGPGIAPQERARVFTRFYRTPGSAGSGVGLGLAIVQEIVRAHRGRLELETPSAGTGLRVRVSLPEAAADSVTDESA